MYFAYGSNMLSEWLQVRCKTARLFGSAVTRGQIVSFSKKSKDGSGKASITRAETDDAAVYGVLYAIDLSERSVLDRFEDYPRGYGRDDSFVVERADNGENIAVTTYIAKVDAIDQNLRPYDWYMALIIAGARENKLPDQYTAELETFICIPDPKPERKARIEALKVLKKSGRAM